MQAFTLMLFGAVSALSLVAALFFLRFWLRTRDRFFLFFSLGFAVYAISQFVHGLIGASEFEPLYYIPRLLTFMLIVAAVVDKNRKRS